VGAEKAKDFFASEIPSAGDMPGAELDDPAPSVVV